MTRLSRTLLDVDPYSDAFQQWPYPSYALLRTAAPVYHLPDHDLVLVSTMQLVTEALADPQTYSNMVHTTRRTPPPPEVAQEIEAIRSQGIPYEAALGLNDPPRHTRYRKLVNRAFMPRSIAWMQPLVDATARELAAALPPGETVDIVEAVARPLPVWAISRILGLPDTWREDTRRWSDAATATIGSPQLSAERALEVEYDMLDFQRRIVPELQRRRIQPTDDLLSSLVSSDPDEEPLTNEELIWLVRELLVAGNETTTKLITDLVLRLDDGSGHWAAMRADPKRIGNTVEEGLRLASPAQGMFRRVTRDATLGGVDLAEGTTLFLAFSSANRDEAFFERPNEFDPDRNKVRQHVAFGRGIHACVGNVLARMETSAMLRELSAKVDGLRVVDRSEIRYLSSFFLRGIPRLCVTVERPPA